MKSYPLIVAGLCLVTVAGCRNTPASPTESSVEPQDTAISVDVTAQDGGEADAAVRAAAAAFVKEMDPSARVEGVFTLRYTRNLYLAGVDCSQSGTRHTVDLLVRQYARSNGAKYWRGEMFGRSISHLIQPDGRIASPDEPPSP